MRLFLLVRTFFFFSLLITISYSYGQSNFNITMESGIEELRSNGRAVFIDEAGNYIIVSRNYFPFIEHSISILKVSPELTIIESSSFLVPNVDFELIHVERITNGDLILAGNDEGNFKKIFVMRVSESGQILWANNYEPETPTIGGLFFPGLNIANNQILITTHFRDNLVAPILLFSIDLNGNLKWSNRIFTQNQSGSFSQTFGDRGHILNTTDNGYLISGFVKGNNTTEQSNALAAKIDMDGNLIWGLEIGGDEEDIFRHAQITPENDYVIVGHTRSFGTGGDIFVTKISESGTHISSKFYELGWFQYPKSSFYDELDNLWIIGNGNGAQGVKGFLMKFDAAGDLESARRSDPSAVYSEFLSISDNNMVLGGIQDTALSLTAIQDFDTHPCFSNELKMIEGEAEMEINTQVFSLAEPMVSTPFSLMETNIDFEMTEWCDPSNTIDISANKLMVVFPNPTSDEIFFTLQTNQLDGFVIEVFDSLGRILQVKDFEYAHKMKLKVAEYASGIYFYNLYQKNRLVQSGKFIRN